MDWILLVILLVAAYGIAAYYIQSRNLWPDHVSFWGPLMMIKTRRVGFFDACLRIRRPLSAYGTLGVAVVILVSAAMVGMLLFSLYINIVAKPAPTAANELRNILAIPGVNEFIPFTFAVWFGLIATMAIHEFGHAILCRAEGIRVKSMGILYAVIPVGAFVEPDDEQLEKARNLKKMRMLGAGIMNNIVAGLFCFGLLVLLLGLAVPHDTPYISTVYKDYPAESAGIVPGSIIHAVNGVEVHNREEVSAILNRTRPGDQAAIVVNNNGILSQHQVTLTAWPEGMGNRTSGFMGVTYYDAGRMTQVFSGFASLGGMLMLMAVPLWVIMNPAQFSGFLILVNDSADAVMWSVPFAGYWQLVHILFWCGWFNIAVGTFNALPLIPLDGGYILKSGTDYLLEKRGLIRYSPAVVSGVTYLMLFVIVAIFTLPILQHM
jgi:membrane-associated protease RseP (regulator of RpoE activity)